LDPLNVAFNYVLGRLGLAAALAFRAWANKGKNQRISDEDAADWARLWADDQAQKGQSDAAFARGDKPGLFGRPDQAFNPFRPAEKGGPGSGPTPLIRQGARRATPPGMAASGQSKGSENKNKGGRRGAAVNNSYELEGKVLSESRQRILRDIKKPVSIPEVKQEKIKHRPKVIGSGPRVVGDDLMKQVECQPSFKQPEDRMWGKFEKNKNARKSQQRKNDVLEIVGASDHAWDYLSENGRKKGEDIVYGNFGGKKVRVVKQENVRSDTLLFLADESGNKTRVLQSEINDNLDYQFNKELFEKYFDEQQTMQYDNDPLFKKVSKRLKSVIDYPDKPAKAGYPDEPPPEMVNGWHPEYGKDKGYYNKLDPQSANAMPSTGNTEIDAKIEKARRIKRIAKGA